MFLQTAGALGLRCHGSVCYDRLLIPMPLELALASNLRLPLVCPVSQIWGLIHSRTDRPLSATVFALMHLSRVGIDACLLSFARLLASTYLLPL